MTRIQPPPAAEADYRAFLGTLRRFAFGLIDFLRLFAEIANQNKWHQRAGVHRALGSVLN